MRPEPVGIPGAVRYAESAALVPSVCRSSAPSSPFGSFHRFRFTLTMER